MDKSLFMQITSMGLADADLWYPLFMRTLRVNKIDKRQDRLFFLSVICAESNSFSQLVDDMDYSSAELKQHFTPRMTAYQCEMLGRTLKQPAQGKAIANLYYNHKNGNSQPSDGWRYRPRGLLPCVGVNTYSHLSKVFDVDLIQCPDLLCEPELAMQSAGYLWRYRGANKLDSLGQISYLFDGNGTAYNKWFKFILSEESKT